MKSLMIQGTSSHAGKSIMVAALLRALRKKGISCAPFKPQNMALNSFVTPDGLEIGRAQAMQAEAAKVIPTGHMNPVLLKPTSDSKAQVIVRGKPWKNLNARNYVEAKKDLKHVVAESFEHLCGQHSVVIVEGAGSPAEINLRTNDIANMGFARMFKLPVMIVGDIDRGGIYASFYGTYMLLTPAERRLVKGYIINKFRGDSSLLSSANLFIRKKTGRPVIGVVPYFTDIAVSDEDGVSLSEPSSRIRQSGHVAKDALRVRVIRLPRISNFTDFEPLFHDELVDMRYVDTPVDAGDAHLVIIPGSKNTIEDLLFLIKSGFQDFLQEFVQDGGHLMGICGGYQMLGRTIQDPHKVETDIPEVRGLSFLNASTVIEKEKQLCQVTFMKDDGAMDAMKGYEIHMGVTESRGGRPLFAIHSEEGVRPDGLVSDDGRVMGTYIHGVFDNDALRLEMLNAVRRSYGLPCPEKTFHFESFKNKAYDRLAALFEKSVNMEFIMKLLRL